RRMIVAMQVGPDGGIGIEILSSIGGLQERPFSPDDDDRLAAQPVTHLRERMPNELLIKLSEILHNKIPTHRPASQCPIGYGPRSASAAIEPRHGVRRDSEWPG